MNIKFHLAPLLVNIVLLFGCSRGPLVNLNPDPWQGFSSSAIQSDIAYISLPDHEGRLIGSQGSQNVVNYIATRLSNLRIAPLGGSYIHQFKTPFGDGHNVAAVIPGRTMSNKYLLYSAHFDGIGSPAPIAKPCNGANDNASGVAALLQLAHYLRDTPQEFSAILLFNDGEGSGLLGAEAFEDSQSSILNDILAVIELDCIGKLSQNSPLYVFNSFTNESKGSAITISPGGLQAIVNPMPASQVYQFGHNSSRNIFGSRGFPQIKFIGQRRSDSLTTLDTLEGLNIPGIISLLDCIPSYLANFLTRQIDSVYRTYSTKLNHMDMLSDLRILSSSVFAGRTIGTYGNSMARKYITQRLATMGAQPLTDSYEQTFTTAGISGTNIVVRIPGTGVTLKKRVILLTAHFDHVAPYFGADDNASSCATLLGMIQYFINHKPVHDVVACFFDGEELKPWFLGAKGFISSNRLPLNTVDLLCNMEMLSHGEEGQLWCVGTRYFPELIDTVSHSFVKSGLPVYFGHDGVDGLQDWMGRSDQQPFFLAGVRSILFVSGPHPDYHTTRDIFERIHPQFYVNSSEAIMSFLLQFDNTSIL